MKKIITSIKTGLLVSVISLFSITAVAASHSHGGAGHSSGGFHSSSVRSGSGYYNGGGWRGGNWHGNGGYSHYYGGVGIYFPGYYYSYSTPYYGYDDYNDNALYYSDQTADENCGYDAYGNYSCVVEDYSW